MRKFFLGLSLFFFCFQSWAVDYIKNSRGFVLDLVELSKDSKAQGSLKSDESRAKLKKVSSQISFTQLAQLSFGKKWATFSAADKKEFLSVLQDLLETVAYPKAQKISADFDQMQFQSAGPKQVKVNGNITREKRGELISEKFELGLIYGASNQIVDAIIEGEKLSKNLNRQFTEALKKKSFHEIIEQMKKRVSDAKKST